MPVSATFHMSMAPEKRPLSPTKSSTAIVTSPTAYGAPSDVTEAEFRKWTVTLSNKLTAEDQKAQHAMRKGYKAHEDGKFWERKQNLHKKTADQFGKAKMEVEAVRQSNLTRGAEYKAELEEMKEMAAQQREDWMQFGHELTVQHGPEQAERTKARLAEMAEAKAEQGRQVKQEAQVNNKQRHTHSQHLLDEKREIVKGAKTGEGSVAEESKNWAFHEKEEKGGEVRRTERKWKTLSKQEKQAFMDRAHANHEKNDATKEHMREARKSVAKKNTTKAQEERDAKTTSAMMRVEKREEEEMAKRKVRDSMHQARYASPEKAELLSKPLAEAAGALGLGGPAIDSGFTLAYKL